VRQIEKFNELFTNLRVNRKTKIGREIFPLETVAKLGIAWRPKNLTIAEGYNDET